MMGIHLNKAAKLFFIKQIITTYKLYCHYLKHNRMF